MIRAAGSGRALSAPRPAPGEGDSAPDRRALASLAGLITALVACFATALSLAQANPHLATLFTTATP